MSILIRICHIQQLSRCTFHMGYLSIKTTIPRQLNRIKQNTCRTSAQIPQNLHVTSLHPVFWPIGYAATHPFSAHLNFGGFLVVILPSVLHKYYAYGTLEIIICRTLIIYFQSTISEIGRAHV